MAGPETIRDGLWVISSIWIGKDRHLGTANRVAWQAVRPSVHVLGVVMAGELVVQEGIGAAL